MSDVLIITGDSAAAHRLREALERDGHDVATARDLISALPALYLSPSTLRVIFSADVGACAEDALLLAAADPGPLGRHSYATFAIVETELSLADEIGV